MHSLITQTGFIILTVACLAVVLRELNAALKQTSFTDERKKSIIRKTILGLVAWMVITSALSLTGILQDYSTPPKLMIVLIVPLPVLLWVTFSSTTREILLQIPPHRIIRLQVFRVFVELLLWRAFTDGALPVQMTFEGRNFDILAGLTAPFVAIGVASGKLGSIAVRIWNLLCLGLLANIVTVAILSLPTPFRVFMNEPANTLVTYFPYVWLPAFLVPLAYSLHFLSLRQYSIQRQLPAL